VGKGPGIWADHLGNVRTVLTTDPNYVFITRQSDYYPFGLEIPLSGTSDNQLKYNVSLPELRPFKIRVKNK